MNRFLPEKILRTPFPILIPLLPLLIFITVSTARLTLAAEIPTEVFEATVLEVVDGDTIRLSDGRLVRYLGVNAPELRKKLENLWVYDPQPFGEAAARFNKKMVEGRKVILEIDPVRPRDRFGRLLAYVFVENVKKMFVNVELLKKGLAKAEGLPLGTKHRILFWSAEEDAWTSKRGIWSLSSEEK